MCRRQEVPLSYLSHSSQRSFGQQADFCSLFFQKAAYQKRFVFLVSMTQKEPHTPLPQSRCYLLCEASYQLWFQDPPTPPSFSLRNLSSGLQEGFPPNDSIIRTLQIP